jgi:hypothetical protein
VASSCFLCCKAVTTAFFPSLVVGAILPGLVGCDCPAIDVKSSFFPPIIAHIPSEESSANLARFFGGGGWMLCRGEKPRPVLVGVKPGPVLVGGRTTKSSLLPSSCVCEIYPFFLS